MPALPPGTDSALPQRYGSRPLYGIGGCLGGLALVALAVVLIVIGTGNRRGFGRGIAIAGVSGIVLLATSFKVTGAEFRPDGVQIWSYIFWFLGSRRFVPAAEIPSMVLGEADGKFTVTLQFADGTEHLIPVKWPSVKDAQAVIDFGTRQYGAGAKVEIEDQAVLSEAANFAGASRFTVTPYKPSRSQGERLPFEDDDEQIAGEVRLLLGWFQGGIGEISEGGAIDSAGARWHLKNGSKVQVSDGMLPAQRVELKSSFTGTQRTLRWSDPAGIVWSGVFNTESDNRTPFTFKFYRGLADEAGSKAERAAVESKQGEPETVAIANGDASSFNVDIADEEAWPWVRIALACAWMRFRPQFSFQKK